MGKLLLSLLLVFSFTFTPISVVRAADSTTGVAQQIELLQDHLVLFPQKVDIGIQEILQIKNKGAEPFKGSSLKDSSGQEKTGWLLPLPKGFTNLEIDGLSSNEFSVVNEGVQIYRSLPSGETQMVLFYSIPSSYPAALSKKAVFPTQSFFLVAPETSTIESNILKSEGVFDVNGKTYRQMSFQGLAEGQVITFNVLNPETSSALKKGRLADGYKVTGHPSGHVALFNSEPLVYTNPHIWAVYLFIMLGLAIAASLLFYRQKQKGKMEPNISTDTGADQEDLLFLKLKRKHDHLLERLKSLDESYRSGKIPEDEYKEVRNNTKKLLVQVKLQLRKLAEDEEALV